METVESLRRVLACLVRMHGHEIHGEGKSMEHCNQLTWGSLLTVLTAIKHGSHVCLGVVFIICKCTAECAQA